MPKSKRPTQTVNDTIRYIRELNISSPGKTVERLRRAVMKLKIEELVLLCNELDIQCDTASTKSVLQSLVLGHITDKTTPPQTGSRDPSLSPHVPYEEDAGTPAENPNGDVYVDRCGTMLPPAQADTSVVVESTQPAVEADIPADVERFRVTIQSDVEALREKGFTPEVIVAFLNKKLRDHETRAQAEKNRADACSAVLGSGQFEVDPDTAVPAKDVIAEACQFLAKLHKDGNKVTEHSKEITTTIQTYLRENVANHVPRHVTEKHLVHLAESILCLIESDLEVPRFTTLLSWEVVKSSLPGIGSTLELTFSNTDPTSPGITDKLVPWINRQEGFSVAGGEQKGKKTCTLQILTPIGTADKDLGEEFVRRINADTTIGLFLVKGISNPQEALDLLFGVEQHKIPRNGNEGGREDTIYSFTHNDELFTTSKQTVNVKRMQRFLMDEGLESLLAKRKVPHETVETLRSWYADQSSRELPSTGKMPEAEPLPEAEPMNVD